MDVLAGLSLCALDLPSLLLVNGWRGLAAANQEYHHSQYRYEPHCFPILYWSGQQFRSSVPCYWLMCHGYQIRPACPASGVFAMSRTSFAPPELS